MTISNSNLLKPFITGSELPPFKEDVFSKTEEQFKKSPHGKLLFISGNEKQFAMGAFFKLFFCFRKDILFKRWQLTTSNKRFQ